MAKGKFMSRSADYTIKGFLYQFNKTLFEILNSQDGDTINVEGIIEDVEIVKPSNITAIQCKYHEASAAFSTSSIFKPLLQMMHHYHENPGTNIQYVLFAYFPSVKKDNEPPVGKTELQAALDSTNKDFEKYVDTLKGKVDLDKFITCFRMEFGQKFEELVGKVCDAFKENGIPEDDINTLMYPNAIHNIATISTKHDPKDRSISKKQFLEELKSIRKTAISRWTLALRTRKQLLDARRKQLKTHLDKNSRLRYFVIDSESISDYKDEIVLFISDYLDKYHYKSAHISTPVFCVCTTTKDFKNIQHRLYKKGIISADGYIADCFEESRFFRDPFIRKISGTITREFSLRLLFWQDHGHVLDNRKCNDLFIIGEPNCDSLNTVDVNVEYLAAQSLKEVKYIIGVSNVYE